MKYFDVFKARHRVYTGANGGGLGIHSNIEKESVAASEIYFTQIAGYKRAKLNFEDGIDIVTESTKTSLEKYIHLRHSAKVVSGDYITYTDKVDREERTYIVQSVNYDQINPIAHGFLCNQSFRLPNIENPILCYSNSTTYGNKGIVDVNSFSQLDSKTKIYVKKTKDTESINLGTRIMFNNRYVYRITECDDVVYPGMYIMVAQRDESLVMDDFENNLAYNDDNKVAAPPVHPIEIEISGASKIKVGQEETFTTKDEVDWEVDDLTSVNIKQSDTKSITLVGIKPTWITLTAKVDGVVRDKKDIMVYK